MLPKNHRLTAAEIASFPKGIRRFSGTYITLIPMFAQQLPKMGIIASKKNFPTSVLRSRVRRRTYEALRRAGGLEQAGMWLLMIPRPSAVTCPYEVLVAELRGLLGKISSSCSETSSLV